MSRALDTAGNDGAADTAGAASGALRPARAAALGQQGPYSPSPYGQAPYGHQPPYGAPPRKRKRVFLWFFLVLQALFIILLIVGLSSKGSGLSVASQVAKSCANGGWRGLFSSHADCVRHYSVALHDADDVGKGIGAALIVVIWIVVDIILGIGYGVYRHAVNRMRKATLTRRPFGSRTSTEFAAQRAIVWGNILAS